MTDEQLAVLVEHKVFRAGIGVSVRTVGKRQWDGQDVPAVVHTDVVQVLSTPSNTYLVVRDLTPRGRVIIKPHDILEIDGMPLDRVIASVLPETNLDGSVQKKRGRPPGSPRKKAS